MALREENKNLAQQLDHQEHCHSERIKKFTLIGNANSFRNEELSNIFHELSEEVSQIQAHIGKLAQLVSDANEIVNAFTTNPPAASETLFEDSEMAESE